MRHRSGQTNNSPHFSISPRVVTPELLDSLPHDDPAAIASRRDLRLLNAIMGNHRWLCHQLTRSGGSGNIVELGAGDGTLARSICRAAPLLAPRLHALDLSPRPVDWPAQAAWHQTDLWSEAARAVLADASIIVANLFLHHFEAAELRQLGRLLPRCNMILACEPVRRPLHIWQGRLLFPILHRVTRHDMTVSIRAGFRGNEISQALGLESPAWKCDSGETFFGACRFSATRSS